MIVLRSTANTQENPETKGRDDTAEVKRRSSKQKDKQTNRTIRSNSTDRSDNRPKNYRPKINRFKYDPLKNN